MPHLHSTRAALGPTTSWPAALVLAVVGLAPLALSQEPTDDRSGQRSAEPDARRLGDRQEQGLSREQMWPAPNAEDWQRPCLVTWQRTWEDAVAVSRETGRPILVCINMDGEIASEHYAGIRYRQPEIAKLYEPYVTVIASVYRHTPRDYDEQGRRIPCPRFGGVTCGEHISIEPFLYEKFMDGKRIAPRHVMVELDGAETYDVYYAWDTASVFDTIRDGMANRNVPITQVRGDKTILERVESHDSRDRAAVETAYAEGDRELKRKLLEAALEHGDVASADLLRLAVFGLDGDLGRLAREALASNSTAPAPELISEALAAPIDAAEREALVAALERLGESSPRARTLAVVHTGLAGRSSDVDVDAWSRALQNEYSPAPMIAPQLLESRIAAQDEVLGSDDAASHLELAEAFLTQALDLDVDAERTQLLLIDARNTALEAERLGATGWRVDAALALASSRLGDVDEAHRRAARAVEDLPSGATSYNAAAVLELFAGMRWASIVNAVREKEDWPKQWLTDIHATCSVLARHPLGSDAHVVWHYDRLKWLGAKGQAARILDEGLERFPDSWELHDRLRTRALEEHGVAGLESVYDGWLANGDASRNLEWFAGYASIVAAEFHRRRGRDAEALAAYDRAVARYEAAIAKNPESRASADHYVAVALGGRARVAYEAGDDDRAVAELLRSFERSPESAATLDGLNLSAVDTAKMVRARLTESKRDDLRERLQAALDDLDPALLELPAYETADPGGAARDRDPARRGRGARGSSNP